MLSILLNPSSRIPVDPKTGQTLTLARERALFRVSALSKARRKVVIPTPACAELLTVIGPEAQQYFEIVTQNRYFEIASFDNKCALELAILNRTTFLQHDQKNNLEPYQRVKLDRQIVAVCKAAGVKEIYTDDRGLSARAVMCGMSVVHSWDLPAPPAEAQGKLNLEKHDELPEASQ